MRVARRKLLAGRCRVPNCYSTPLVGLASILSRRPCCPTFEGVPLDATLRLLVWASVRVLGAGRVEQRSNGGCWAQGVCRGQSSNRGVRKRSGGCFWRWSLHQVFPKAMKQTTGTMLRLCGGSNNCVRSVSPTSNGVDRKLGNAPDPGRLRCWRRFQTRKPWLRFLAFSTYLTRIASPGPMLVIIQIVKFRSSSTSVNDKNQHGT